MEATTPSPPRFFHLLHVEPSHERLRAVLANVLMCAAINAPAMSWRSMPALSPLMLLTPRWMDRGFGCPLPAGCIFQASAYGAVASTPVLTKHSVWTTSAGGSPTLLQPALWIASPGMLKAVGKASATGTATPWQPDMMGDQDPPQTMLLPRARRRQLEGGLTPICSRLGRALQFMGLVTGLGRAARSTRGWSRPSGPIEFEGWARSLGPLLVALRRIGGVSTWLLRGPPSRFPWTITLSALRGRGSVKGR